MNRFFQRQGARFAKRASSFVRKFFGATWWRDWTRLGRSDGLTSEKANYQAEYWCRKYDECTILQRPVRRICEDVAKVQWKLKRRVRSKSALRKFVLVDVEEHPLLDLLRKPNEDMLGTLWREMYQRYQELAGRTVVHIERDEKNIPNRLTLIEPEKLEQTPRDNAEGVFRFKVNGETVPVQPENVMWVVSPSASNLSGHGVGLATAITREILLDEKSSDWSLSIYRNGSQVGAIVYVPDLEDEELDRMQAHYDKNHTGIENVGKTLFLSSEGGSSDSKSPVSVTKMGTAHRELDYTASKQALADRVRENWGVPPELVGDVKNSNRASMVGADFIHQSTNILYRLLRMAEELNERLVPLFGEPDLVLVFENPVKEEAEFRHRALLEGVKNGAANRDEWRADRQLDPMAGKLGAAVSLPLNMHHVDVDGNALLQPDHNAPEPLEEDDAAQVEMQPLLERVARIEATLKGLKW